MHKGKESQQAIVVSIIIAIRIRLMLSLPQTADERTTQWRCSSQRDCCCCSDKSERMTEILGIGPRSQCINDITAVNIVLIYKCIDAFTVEETLYAVSIMLLPFSIFTSPRIIECDIHWYAPRIESEACTQDPFMFQRTTIIVCIIICQSSNKIHTTVQVLSACLRTFTPKVRPTILCPTSPHLIKSWYVIRRIGKAAPQTIRSKCYEAVVWVNKGSSNAVTLFHKRTVKDMTCIAKIIYSR